MKNFNQYVTEAPTGRWNQTPVTYNQTDPFDLANPTVLQRVNAFVGSIADREYLIPEAAIQQLRNFMLRIGVQFPKVDLPDGGSISLPLSQWGGRFGKDLDTPYDEFVNDDGLQGQLEGGLNLEIRYYMDDYNTCRMYAEIK